MSNTKGSEERIQYAAEVFLDFMARVADGKDDDDIVSAEPEIRALAEACGVDPDTLPDLGLQTAGEVRAKLRAGKAELARAGGPSDA